ncbi:flippase [Streptococcus suis]
MMVKEKRSLTVNSVLNVIKQLCVIIFPMITFPYASRVLGVTNYGKINFGQSIISYIALIAALGITNYAIREGAQKREHNSELSTLINELFTLSVYSTIFSYIILGLLCFFWADLRPYTTLLIIQSMIVVFTTLGTDWINSIFEDYFFITIRYILCQIISIVLMFVLVKEPEDYLMYAFVSVSANILANIWNIYHIRKKLKIKLRFVEFSGIKKHFKSVFYMFVSSIATLVYINSDITMLGIMKDDTVVGYYSVSVKIYSLIKQLVNAFMIVSIPRFSNYIGNGKLDEVQKGLNSLFTFLILMIGPAMSGLYSLSSDIIFLFAGKDYIKATPSLQILSFAIFFSTLACFYINVVMIPFMKEKLILKATIISASVNILLNFVLIPSYGANAAALTTLISEMLLVVFGIYYMRNSLELRWKVPLLISSLISIIVYFICQFVISLGLNRIQEIIFSAFISLIVFLFITVPYLKMNKMKILIKK